MKHVVIIGGGYAGTQLARALDKDVRVTLVEPRDGFVHNVGAIRAVVDPAILDSLILPYDRLLRNGGIVRDRAVGLRGNTVDLAGGGSLTGDVVVIATGSTYASPFKPVEDGTAAFRAASQALHERLVRARSVAIVGGGAVGVELAGEIASTLPGKTVTLVSATPSLFPEFQPQLGKALVGQLGRMGVSLHLGARAQVVDRGAGTTETLHLSNGGTLAADLIIPAMGARPVADLGKALPGTKLDLLGRLSVDPWLRVGGRPTVFSLGDAASTGDMMTIVAISRQVPWLADIIRAKLAGKSVDQMPAYAPWSAPPILVPLGPKRGASVLPISKQGLVVGSLPTSAIKGKKLFVPRYQKEFGLA